MMSLRHRTLALSLLALSSGTISCGNSGDGGGASAGAASGGSSSSSAGVSGTATNGGAGSGGVVGSSGSSSGGKTGSAGASGHSGSSTGSGGGSTSGGSSGAAGTNDGSAGGGDDAPDGWKLTWSDDFDGDSGKKPDSSKWGYDLGGDGWGNNELEYYTDRTDNSATDGQGHLVITLKAEKYMNRDYTSARLLSKGKFSQAYGRFEARIKVPQGQGVWPAFWMLGADIETNAWPQCGEIDIMEVAGKEPRVNHGSLHGPGYSGGNPLTATTTATSSLADDFHLYAVEWEENVVRFYVDDKLYETRKNTDVPSGGTWVYDHPFFIILNVAIGGAFGGPPDSSTVLPQTMTVDYVRVYQRE